MNHVTSEMDSPFHRHQFLVEKKPLVKSTKHMRFYHPPFIWNTPYNWSQICVNPLNWHKLTMGNPGFPNIWLQLPSPLKYPWVGRVGWSNPESESSSADFIRRLQDFFPATLHWVHWFSPASSIPGICRLSHAEPASFAQTMLPHKLQRDDRWHPPAPATAPHLDILGTWGITGSGEKYRYCISTIHPSYWSHVHQLSWRTGAPPCRKGWKSGEQKKTGDRKSTISSGSEKSVFFGELITPHPWGCGVMWMGI